MLSWEQKSKTNQDSFVFPFCFKPKMHFLFQKAPKRGWNPSIQTNPMKNLKIYGNFLRHNWTFKCQIVNCSTNLYTFQFSIPKMYCSHKLKCKNQILTVCKLILNQRSIWHDNWLLMKINAFFYFQEKYNQLLAQIPELRWKFLNWARNPEFVVVENLD